MCEPSSALISRFSAFSYRILQKETSLKIYSTVYTEMQQEASLDKVMPVERN